MNNALRTVLDYHERTKHRFERYAAGPGGLDWANQPDPFRTFAGAPQIALPLLGDGPEVRYTELHKQDLIAPSPLTLDNLAALLELSLGLSAWKEYGGTRWALRCNPSSGNLHPTEAYVVVEACPGVANGVYHYVSRDHLLEHRCSFTNGDRDRALPPGSLLVGLSSIHWREAWKYGERAYRYCQHDVGHAIAAMRYAAAVLGWRARLLPAWGDTDIAAVLGTDRDVDFGASERELPDLMLQVSTAPTEVAAALPPDGMVEAARNGLWRARANPLSADHSHHWAAIDEVAAACTKPRTGEEMSWRPPPLPHRVRSPCPERAVDIIRQRRSAQAFDGVTAVDAAAFYRMLDMTLPRAGTVPWDVIPWGPRVHLLLFVHRVEGLPPGLYLLLRDRRAEARARTAISHGFEWTPVEGCPAHLALFQLAAGDARSAARTLSCHQDIAADSAFSLGMLAEYEPSLTLGPWVYRQLFWEAGILGQVLYLEAEAAGVRGTGIGCYFDDGVHELAGINDRLLQSLYHFTVGGALTDARLQTLPPYAHLKR